MIAETIPAVKSLSDDDKIALAAELWRDVVKSGDTEIDPQMVSALTERLDYYAKHPEESERWEVVRERFKTKG